VCDVELLDAPLGQDVLGKVGINIVVFDQKQLNDGRTQR
jgi:hypothetical protein